MLAETVDLTLCFLQQDNNAVLGITTAYCLKNETIWRLRKRPSPTSTNARIVRPVFGDDTSKWLAIPLAIDRYNHHMNSVDRANQLRKNGTIHRKFEQRNWRPQWYWVFDTCCVNSFLIWKTQLADKGRRKHTQFREELTSILLNWPYDEKEQNTQNKRHQRYPLPLSNSKVLEHKWDRFLKRGYCVWCKEGAEKWVPHRPPNPLTEIVNSAAQPKRARHSQTWGGCGGCEVYLCLKGNCMKAFHSRTNTIQLAVALYLNIIMAPRPPDANRQPPVACGGDRC